MPPEGHPLSDEDRRAQLKEGTNIFRVLIKTLLHAGIITQRTAPLYAVWVDMKELEAEGEGIPGDIANPPDDGLDGRP